MMVDRLRSFFTGRVESKNGSSGLFPSPWICSFRSKQAFDDASRQLGAAFGVFDQIDDRMLASRHGFSMKAYCSACEAVTHMRVDWLYSAGDSRGSVAPAWTETAVCEVCGLNSRMRALIDFMRRIIEPPEGSRVYVAESTTASFKVLSRLFTGLQGSEFLDASLEPGSTKFLNGKLVRHEDLTKLSFDDSSFDLVLTQDVFEHIPSYKSAFAEIYRVLSHGGSLVFTIPFFFDRSQTTIRASVDDRGEVIHHLPPEVHGNPVSAEGSLCFQNIGWDVLDDLGTSKNLGTSVIGKIALS